MLRRSSSAGLAWLRQSQASASARRTFLSFASPSRSLVKSHTETKVVPFSCEEMFDVVADVDRYNEFLPFCVESRVLRRANENVMEAALRVGFHVFTEAYTSRVIMNRPYKIAIKSIESPTFKRIESEWMFKPLSNPNTCEVQFKVTFEVASFLHANAIQLFFDDVALTQLNAFIGRTRKLQQLRARQVPPQQSAPASPPPVSPPQPVEAVSSTPLRVQSSPAPPSSLTDDFSIPGASLDRINCYNASAAEVASNSIKQSMRTQDFEDIKAVFDQYAVDDGTKMYFAGFSKACRQLAVEYDDFRDISTSPTLAGTIFSSLEVSGTQKDWLNVDEFVVGVYLMTKGTVEEKARSLFLVIDTSQDGKISREELTTAMQRRIHTVKRIFPKLLTDQVELQMECEQVKKLEHCTDEAVSKGLEAIESMMKDIEKEIPLAVNQIFLEADLDQDDFITEDEWLFAWHLHPEFVELMTIDGMKKVAQWASVVKTEDSEHEDTRLTHVD